MKKINSIACVLFCLISLSCVNEEFGGIGIEVPTRHEKVSKANPYIVVSVFKGGSGESSGIKTGDTIVSIDGRPLDGLYEDYIVKNLLRGKTGSYVTVEIERGTGADKKVMVFRMPRVRIVLQE